MSKDVPGGGTEDLQKSTQYCSHCYLKGQFAEPSLTVEQMVAKVQGKLKSMHVPGFMVKSFTRNIPALKRWQSKCSNIAGV